MRRRLLLGVALAAVTLILAAAHAQAEEFHARLNGFNEVGAQNNESGAILSGGTGTVDVDLDESAQTATYTLTFSGLGSPVAQAHIHFGKVHVAGGIMVFFCSNLGNGPAGTPACPPSGTVTGSWNASSVIAIPKQNVPAGDFDALVQALESNTAYANIHTANFPAGEIRGQVHRARGEDRDQGR